MYEGKDRTLYRLLGSYQTVKNHNNPRKREEAFYQALLTALPNGSYVIHYVNKTRHVTETSKSTSDGDIKAWFDVYLKCYRSADGYARHAQVSNWYYKCNRYMEEKDFLALQKQFYPQGINGISSYQPPSTASSEMMG